MIQGLVDWLTEIILTIGYPGVSIAMALESFFAPIPSEALIPFIGYMSYTGDLNVWISIIVTSVSSYIGTLPFYFIGYLGEDTFEKFLRKYGKYLFISDEGVDRVFSLFEKYGNKIVFVAKLIPTVRSLIPFPAGIAKMNFLVFTIYSLLGSLVFSAIFIFSGYLLGDSWEKVIAWISGYEKIVVVILLLAILGYIGYVIYKKIKKKDLKETK